MLNESLEFDGDRFPPFFMPTKHVVGVRIEYLVASSSDVVLDSLVRIFPIELSSQVDIVPVDMPSIDRDK